MIISKIQGGLGNQMFQYAFARFLSSKHNVRFFLDTSFYKNNIGAVTRLFLLDKFPNTNINEFNPINLKYPIQRIPDNFFFNKIEILPNMDYYLDGYWQSEKYFLEIREELRNEFSPPTNVLDKLLKTISTNSNSVSIHIRRTDYVTSNGYHPVQTVEYYENALNIIGDYDNLFVFSDDIQWCKNNLNFKKMIFVESLSEIEDLWLMSLCKNNIIANSTFSWWGAWLNKNPNKKVVAPIKWFGSQTNLNTSDIIPEDWLKI